MSSTPADPSDAIAAALARLRGRRMPRPPWADGSGPHGEGPHAHGHGGHGHGGPHSHDADDAEDHAHGDDPTHGFPGRRGGGGPWGRGAVPGFGGPGFGGPGFGGPPWGGAARIGGPARMRLLEALAAASHPLSVGEIAEAVGVDQPRASRLVQQAVQLDLVRREADPDDARRTRVALTDAGTRLVRGFRGERREAMDAALAAFTDDERAELARLLTKLADSWP
ncbi:MarR family winged helix-turn-helix transcriptional regulator [Microbacterium sp. ZW T2_14]|uniref:MarR family winged helix-turn-helix transcriptional regulator n=1 Tax=Microbacterium sp. ZW T2_14 TaxID=3378079 RepID=UPI0038548AC4